MACDARGVPFTTVFALATAVVVGAGLSSCAAQATGTAVTESAAAKSIASAYAVWKNGPPSDPDFFPLAVWLQPARRAKDYKEAGVNIYIGQWKGPTEKQLELLRQANMPLICDMNEVGLKHLDDKLIIGWLQPDEPDIAHAHLWEELRNREKPSETFGAYRPPYHPDEIRERYLLMKAVDPTRPVFVSLSLAVVYGDAAARGNRKNHNEDYPAYLKGLDIVAFDIYPGIHQHPPAAAKYWTVAKGVKNLLAYADGKRPVWVDIEAMKPYKDHNPHTFKAEVWMAIIHGAMGINYYVHQNASGRAPIPSIEDSVFVDSEMLAAFTATNRLVTSLARVINSPTVEGAVRVASSVPASEEVAAAGLEPIAAMVKRHGGATYLFTVRMENSSARGTFQVTGLAAKATAKVLGENRMVDIRGGRFEDDFGGMDVHLYKITPTE